MKKLCSVLMIITVFLLFTSCVIDRSEYFSPAQSVDQIKSISIHYIGNDIYVELELGDALASIKSDDYKSFCEELKTLYYEDGVIVFPPVAQDPNLYHHGYLINIEYKNGGYDRLTYGLRTWKNEDDGGIGLGSCDEEAFHNIIEKYSGIDCNTDD